MSSPRTFVKRIYLDSLFNRSSDSSNHWVGTTLKAYRVLATNNKSFQLNIVADPDNGAIQGIPMGKVRLHNYTQIAKNAVLENSVVQAGVWVDILFSTEDELTWTGDDSQQPSTVISEGSNHSSARVDLSTSATPTEIIPADDNRATASLQCKSGGVFWIGNPAELSSADWKNICQKVNLAVDEIFQWRNSGALNARTDVAACVFSLLKEMKA